MAGAPAAYDGPFPECVNCLRSRPVLLALALAGWVQRQVLIWYIWHAWWQSF
jgi:hypothetical protein